MFYVELDAAHIFEIKYIIFLLTTPMTSNPLSNIDGHHTSLSDYLAKFTVYRL